MDQRYYHPYLNKIYLLIYFLLFLMEKNISIFVIDESNNIIGEKTIKKPVFLSLFKPSLEEEFDNLPTHYKILYQSEENDLCEITNEKEYNLAKNIIFIKQINEKDLNKSIFTLNYNQLSDSQQDLLDEKFCCFICSDTIKNEDPPFCYICQKNFHYKCLEKWEMSNASLNKILNCPNCRNQLPLKNWKKRLNFEEIRQNEAKMMNEIKNYKDKNDIFQKIINKKEFDKLEEKDTGIEEKFEVFKKLTSNLLKNILINLNEISSSINSKLNKEICQLIYRVIANPLQPPINDIYNTISEEFEVIKKFINNKLYLNKSGNNILANEEKLNNNKKEINLLYYSINGGKEKIFGKTFVENNRDNIDIIINGNKEALIDEYLLKKGDNNIELKLKNELNKIEEMFYGCKTLKNIDDLKYLNTSKIKDFSCIFFGCVSLENINSLENWDVSKGNNFQGVFAECQNILNLKPLEKWKVSNGTNFKNMFYNCKSLDTLIPLNNWNVSKNGNFSYMFSGCSSLKDLYGLEFWNVSNGKKFENMFSGCTLLSNVEALKNWNVSLSNSFNSMFENCSSLSDIKPLNNWKVTEYSKGSFMFRGCSPNLDLTTLKNLEIKIYDQLK